MLFNAHETLDETSIIFFKKTSFAEIYEKLFECSTHGRFRNNIHVYLPSMFISLTEVS